MLKGLRLCYHAQSPPPDWQLIKPNGRETPAASLMKYTAHQFEKRLQQTAPEVFEQFKVEDKSRRYNFWQSQSDWFLLNYIPTIEQKLNYIHCNPLQPKWRLCELATDYPFSSANFYVSGNNKFDFLHNYNEFVESELWLSSQSLTEQRSKKA